MSTALDETLPAGALQLAEAPQDAAAEVQSDGSVLIHVLRPCVGRGRGRHLYTADMLRENAHKFSGWPMYVDHLSPAARRAAGGLPRSLRDVGGWIEESWWDDSVPAEPAKGYGQGAVIAKAQPFGLAEALVKRAPQIVKTSISTAATGARPVMHEGQRVMLVEGIADEGSVDWVTEAGAGGRVVALMEAVYDEFADDEPLMEALDDQAFIDYLDRERPHLREALDTARRSAEPATEGGADMGEVTPDVLQEALQSEAGLEVLNRVIDARVTERMEAQLPALVEARLDTERDLIRAEAEAVANRRVDLRDLRDLAHSTIQEAKLPDSWKDGLKREFDLSESGEPTPALDVIDELDDDGKVTKTATAVLREALAAKITERRNMLQEARPTRVGGLGPSKRTLQEANEVPGGGADTTDKPAPDEKRYAGTLTGSLLQEAGINADTAWDNL